MMKPSMCLSNLESLDEIKKEIRSLLVSRCNVDVTLHQLSIMYKEEIGDDISFIDFNHASLEEFLSSMSDTVYFTSDKNNEIYVHHVKSKKTRHLSSLIARQVKKSRNSEYKRKLCPTPIDPLILSRVMSKLSCGSTKKVFNKVDVLTEVKAVIGAHCFYTIEDLNAQLNELLHILLHDGQYVYLKNGKKSCRLDGPADFVKESTKERLQKLADKYQDGIRCAQLSEVYCKEYRMDLEYHDLVFYDIVEFVHTFPNILKFVNPPNSLVINARMSDDYLRSLAVRNSVENATTDVTNTSQAVHTPFSRKVSNQLIPKEFMNLDENVGQIDVDIILENSKLIPEKFMNYDDTVEKTNVETILENSDLSMENSDISVDVIVTEICNPSLFWIILRKERRRLVTLMDDLQDFYNKQDLDECRVLPTVLKPGLHIACIYSKRWHRGVIKTMESNSLTILLYDFGITKVYKASDIYFLHKPFSSLPAQAVPYSLYKVKPVDDNIWPKKSVEKFAHKVMEKTFAAHVFNINQKNNLLILDLVRTSKSKDIHISQWMVSKNLAKHGTYTFETDNFTNKRLNGCSKKKESEPVEGCQNVNEDSMNEDLVQNSGCFSHEKQLEALKKYKKRFNLLDSVSCSSNSTSNSFEKFDESMTMNANVNCKQNNDEKNFVDKNITFSSRSDSHDEKIINTQDQMQKVTQKNINKALKELQRLITLKNF